MKKWIALCLTLAFALSGCAGQTPAPEAPEASVSAPVSDPADASAGAASSAPETDPADASAPDASGMAFGSASASGAPAREEKPRPSMTFGYSAPASATPAQAAMSETLLEAAQARGDSLTACDPAKDAQEQSEQLSELAEQGVDAVFVCPVDASQIEEGLAALRAKGIPVLGFGEWNSVPEDIVTVTVSDEYNAGYLCGEDLAEKCPDGGTVMVLEQSDSETVMQRVTGFLEATEEAGVPFDVVGELDFQGERETACERTQEVLAIYPDVTAIFAGSDEAAFGAQDALEQLDAKSDCMIYSSDGSPELKEQLGHSSIEGAGAQSPVTMAETLIETAYQYIDGEDVATEVTIPTFLVTADNVEEFGAEDWQ